MAISPCSNCFSNAVTSLKAAARIGVAVGGLVILGKVLYEIYKRAVADRPFPYVPSNLSAEAKQYLQTATPVGGRVTDPLGWINIRAGFRQATIKVSERIKEAYIQKSHEFLMVNNATVLVTTPKDYQENSRALIYIHGGAWTLGDPNHLYQIFAPIAHATSLKTYAINYPLAPEDPYPAGLNACLAVYQKLLETHNPKDIFFLGDSAGANLCIATILRARESGIAMPAAVGVNSPVVDLEKASDTHFTLAGRDPKLLYEQSLLPSIEAYAGDTNLQDPLLSVIHADFTKGFPPITIHVGSREVLLGDSARLNEALHNAGQSSSLHVFDGLWHGVQEHGFERESSRSTRLMAEFFKSHFREEQSV